MFNETENTWARGMQVECIRNLIQKHLEVPRRIWIYISTTKSSWKNLSVNPAVMAQYLLSDHLPIPKGRSLNTGLDVWYIADDTKPRPRQHMLPVDLHSCMSQFADEVFLKCSCKSNSFYMKKKLRQKLNLEMKDCNI